MNLNNCFVKLIRCDDMIHMNKNVNSTFSNNTDVSNKTVYNTRSRKATKNPTFQEELVSKNDARPVNAKKKKTTHQKLSSSKIKTEKPIFQNKGKETKIQASVSTIKLTETNSTIKATVPIPCSSKKTIKKSVTFANKNLEISNINKDMCNELGKSNTTVPFKVPEANMFKSKTSLKKNAVTNNANTGDNSKKLEETLTASKTINKTSKSIFASKKNFMEDKMNKDNTSDEIETNIDCVPKILKNLPSITSVKLNSVVNNPKKNDLCYKIENSDNIVVSKTSKNKSPKIISATIHKLKNVNVNKDDKYCELEKMNDFVSSKTRGLVKSTSVNKQSVVSNAKNNKPSITLEESNCIANFSKYNQIKTTCHNTCNHEDCLKKLQCLQESPNVLITDNNDFSVDTKTNTNNLSKPIQKRIRNQKSKNLSNNIKTKTLKNINSIIENSNLINNLTTTVNTVGSTTVSMAHSFDSSLVTYSIPFTESIFNNVITKPTNVQNVDNVSCSVMETPNVVNINNDDISGDTNTTTNNLSKRIEKFIRNQKSKNISNNNKTKTLKNVNSFIGNSNLINNLTTTVNTVGSTTVPMAHSFDSSLVTYSIPFTESIFNNVITKPTNVQNIDNVSCSVTETPNVLNTNNDDISRDTKTTANNLSKLIQKRIRNQKSKNLSNNNKTKTLKNVNSIIGNSNLINNLTKTVNTVGSTTVPMAHSFDSSLVTYSIPFTESIFNNVITKPTNVQNIDNVSCSVTETPNVLNTNNDDISRDTKTTANNLSKLIQKRIRNQKSKNLSNNNKTKTLKNVNSIIGNSNLINNLTTTVNTVRSTTVPMAHSFDSSLVTYSIPFTESIFNNVITKPTNVQNIDNVSCSVTETPNVLNTNNDDISRDTKTTANNLSKLIQKRIRNQKSKNLSNNNKTKTLKNVNSIIGNSNLINNLTTTVNTVRSTTVPMAHSFDSSLVTYSIPFTESIFNNVITKPTNVQNIDNVSCNVMETPNLLNTNNDDISRDTKTTANNLSKPIQKRIRNQKSKNLSNNNKTKTLKNVNSLIGNSNLINNLTTTVDTVRSTTVSMAHSFDSSLVTYSIPFTESILNNVITKPTNVQNIDNVSCSVMETPNILKTNNDDISGDTKTTTNNLSKRIEKFIRTHKSKNVTNNNIKTKTLNSTVESVRSTTVPMAYNSDSLLVMDDISFKKSIVFNNDITKPANINSIDNVQCSATETTTLCEVIVEPTATEIQSASTETLNSAFSYDIDQISHSNIQQSIYDPSCLPVPILDFETTEMCYEVTISQNTVSSQSNESPCGGVERKSCEQDLDRQLFSNESNSSLQSQLPDALVPLQNVPSNYPLESYMSTVSPQSNASPSGGVERKSCEQDLDRQLFSNESNSSLQSQVPDTLVPFQNVPSNYPLESNMYSMISDLQEDFEREILLLSKRFNIPIDSLKKIAIENPLSEFHKKYSESITPSMLKVSAMVKDTKSENPNFQYKIEPIRECKAYKTTNLKDLMTELSKTMPSWSFSIIINPPRYIISHIKINEYGYPLMNKCVVLDKFLRADVYINHCLDSTYSKCYSSAIEIVNLIKDLNSL